MSWGWRVAAMVVIGGAGVVASAYAPGRAHQPRSRAAQSARVGVAAPTTQKFATFTSPSTKPFAPLANQEDLHNAHIVTAKVISGAQPEGDKSFQLLQELGVKTIISVDGGKPDAERAGKYGMRYVHLPIGYDGVDEVDGKAIAKAIAELPGPVYVHCHHGKHRSAAAVAVACVYNGELKPEQAEDVLETFGTGANYKGLWKDARAARRVDDKELAALQIEWVEGARISDLAEAMVKVDLYNDHLKEIQKAGWKAPAHHPDLDPAHEALLLQEHFTEIGRTDDTKMRPADYVKSLKDSERAVITLRSALAATPVDTRTADAAFKVVATNCTTCHKSYRDQ